MVNRRATGRRTRRNSKAYVKLAAARPLKRSLFDFEFGNEIENGVLMKRRRIAGELATESDCSLMTHLKTVLGTLGWVIEGEICSLDLVPNFAYVVLELNLVSNFNVFM